jgi:putative membrane protein
MKRVALAFLIVFLACNRTESGSTSTTDTAPAATDTSVTPGDLEFAQTVAMANLYEIKAGQFAIEKTTNPKYKEFAQIMVAQHTEILAALDKIAKDQHFTLPDKLDGEFLTLYETLTTTAAGQFDDVYREQMISTHISALMLFSKEAYSGKDPELKKFAEKWLPTIEHHLQMATALPACT